MWVTYDSTSVVTAFQFEGAYGIDVYSALSKVKTLNGLLLTNKLNDDLAKLRISFDLLKEYKGLDGLDKTFQGDIKWDLTNISIGFNK